MGLYRGPSCRMDYGPVVWGIFNYGQFYDYQTHGGQDGPRSVQTSKRPNGDSKTPVNTHFDHTSGRLDVWTFGRLSGEIGPRIWTNNELFYIFEPYYWYPSVLHTAAM